MDLAGLRDLTGLGLAGVALIVLGLTIKALVQRKPRDSENLRVLIERVDDLEGRIERKDIDLEGDFGKLWNEIEALRKFRHDHAGTLTVVELLTIRMQELARRLDELGNG